MPQVVLWVLHHDQRLNETAIKESNHLCLAQSLKIDQAKLSPATKIKVHYHMDGEKCSKCQSHFYC